jgi:hypothetical protein
VVRLYSVTGCRTIEWDKPKAKDLLAQRRKQGVLAEGATNAIINTSYDKTAFDCCIASTFSLCERSTCFIVVVAATLMARAAANAASGFFCCC